MDDLRRCFTSAAFSRRNAGTLFSKSVPYLIGPANRRQNLHATQQQSPNTSLYMTIFHFYSHYKYDSTRQSSYFANLSGQYDGKDFSDHLSGFAATIGQRPCRWRIRHPMTYIVHAACLHHLLASGIWRLGERARKLHHGRYIITTWINTILDHWAGRNTTIIKLWIMNNIDSFIAFIVHLQAPWRKNGRQSRRK